jgi:hypothetical protein
MSDPKHKLWCYIEGDTVVFHVFVSTTISVDELKEMIKEKRSRRLEKFDAADLILWKVRYF